MSEVIPHAELIRAVLDGATVQVVDSAGNVKKDWAEFDGFKALCQVVNHPRENFRIKPAEVTLYAAIIPSAEGPHLVGQSTLDKARETARAVDGGRIFMVTFNPDSGELIDASIRTEI